MILLMAIGHGIAMTNRLLTALSCFAAALCVGVSVYAQAPGSEARMPVKVIAGRLVVRCELSTKFRRIPANLFVDYDRACGLELHNRAAHGIKVDDGGGVPITIGLVTPQPSPPSASASA